MKPTQLLELLQKHPQRTHRPIARPPKKVRCHRRIKFCSVQNITGIPTPDAPFGSLRIPNGNHARGIAVGSCFVASLSPLCFLEVPFSPGRTKRMANYKRARVFHPCPVRGPKAGVKQVQANAPPLANRRGHGANQAKFKVKLVQSMTINLGSTTAQVCARLITTSSGSRAARTSLD